MIVFNSTAIPVTDFLKGLSATTQATIRLPQLPESLTTALEDTEHRDQSPAFFHQLEPFEASTLLQNLRHRIFERASIDKWGEIGEGWRMTEHRLSQAGENIKASPLYIGAQKYLNLDQAHIVTDITAKHFNGQMFHSRIEESGINFIEVGNSFFRTEMMVRLWGNDTHEYLSGTTGSIDLVRYKFKLPPHLTEQYVGLPHQETDVLVLAAAQMLFFDQFSGTLKRTFYEVHQPKRLPDNQLPEHVIVQAMISGTNKKTAGLDSDLAHFMFTSAKMVVDKNGQPWVTCYVYRPFGFLEPIPLGLSLSSKLTDMGILKKAA